MITHEQLARTIDEFRKVSFRRHPTDHDFVPAKERDERFGYVLEELQDFLLTETNQPIDQLCRLIKTPRMLKTVLRHVQSEWDRLHGEIDLDDLLAATTLRFAAPGAFDFLLNNFRTIRALRNAGIGNENRERAEGLNTKWSVIPAKEWDITSARRLVSFLFPMWSQEAIGRVTVPQGVAASTPTDYWQRLLEGALRSQEIGDQETVQAIKRWMAGDRAEHFRGITLAQALAADAKLPGKFEQIAPFFLDGQQFRNLASELFAAMLNMYDVHTDGKGTEGFTALWRCALRHPINREAHQQWILREIVRYLPRSLRLANDLYYFWAANEEHEARGGNRNHLALRADVVREAKALYDGHPDLFLRVLDPAFMYTSYHFAKNNGEPRQGGPGFVTEEWRWFMHLLLDAGALDPDTITPQISSFVVDEEMFPYRCEFRDGTARELFGDEYDRLLDLLRQEIDVSRFDERERNRLITVREAAIRLIGDKSPT